MSEKEFVEACLGTLLDWLPGSFNGVRITPEREDIYRVEMLDPFGYPVEGVQIFRITVTAEAQ